MLTNQQLSKIINKSQTGEVNIFREYAQHLFLSALYRESGSEKLLFKGGTAYRIAYKSPRFSEDLDFSATDIKVAEIEKIILNSIAELSNNGITCEIEESKPTTGGYLARVYTHIYNQKIPIDIQISLRKREENDSQIFDILNEFIPTYQAVLLSERIMIGEKITASLTRSKPRDFYDIYFLLKNGFLTSLEKDKLGEVKKVLLSKKVKFKEELSNFLPRSMKIMAESFPTPLINEIDKFF